ncbi:MAG: glycosyltransferase family 2 protein [Anaerolineae bacterium]|nr:glycosyltransferase family 2 protein [Anaerolineae bacterium]
MSNQIDLSIIIPTYNRLVLLQNAIASFHNQLDCTYEAIIVDDGSTDGTREYLQTLEAPFISILQDHLGAAAARNTGMNALRGRYVKFLDDDDLLDPQVLQRQMKYLDQNQDVEVCYSDWGQLFQYTDRDVADEKKLVIAGEKGEILDELLSDWWCSPANYLYRNRCITNIRWDLNAWSLDDFDFVVHVSIDGARFGYLPTAPEVASWNRVIVNVPSLARRDLVRRFHAHKFLLDKFSDLLKEKGLLTPKRKCLLARQYFNVALRLMAHDRTKSDQCIQKMRALCPDFSPPGRRMPILVRLIGYKGALALLHRLGRL